MYLQLMHRSYGVHEPIKRIEIPCDFNAVYLGEDNINEQLLLEHIPKGWLPVEAKNILLTVGDEYGSTGQRGLKVFRNWAKYFDCYILELHEKPLQWWGE